MEAQTITQISRHFNVSARMLRYYEQAGLLESFRKEDYAYRMYDETAVSRLRQVLILRKLRIPIKQIKAILQNNDARATVELFRRNINELDSEITALSTIRNILSHFVDELQRTAAIQFHCLITQEDAVMAAIKSLSLTSINFKEDRTMDKLNEAEKELSTLADVRIIYLPPAAVAAAHYIGDDPESRAYAIMDKFVRDAELSRIKPDLRHYGFNHPNPVDETGRHGYEIWVTIPDDMDVPSPLVKKRFEGGLYAAHMIAMGSFNEWDWLLNWVGGSDKYEFAGDMSDQEHMCGLLEEHLNYVSHVNSDSTEPEDMQLDLLMPVRERNNI